jgi:hypothetical protein
VSSALPEQLKGGLGFTPGDSANATFTSLDDAAARRHAGWWRS